MLQWFILMILIGKANVMDDLRCDHDMGENDDHDMPEDEGGQSIAKSIEIAIRNGVWPASDGVPTGIYKSIGQFVSQFDPNQMDQLDPGIHCHDLQV